MKLLLIRHGESDLNVKGITHRTGDSASLTDLGKQQALQAARICADKKIQALYTSSEKRARQTAKIISTITGLKVVVLEGFQERNWGNWEGRPWSEIEAILRPMALEERYTFVPPGGESWQQMQMRLEKALSNIAQNKLNCVAVITHEGAMSALMPIIKHEPKESAFRYEFKNGSVTELNYP